MAQDPLAKLEIAKQRKETGDQAFKTGEIRQALRSYHEALLYLQGIDKNLLDSMSGNGAPSPLNSPPQNDEDKEPTEIEDLLSKVYGNQSACHMKSGNWKRAWECADKALQKNKKNYKAQFRKGKAQAELGYVEKAEATLTDLLNKNPSDAAAVNAELSRIRAADKEREKKHNQKFKGFLNRGKGSETSGGTENANPLLAHGFIEEVVDEPAAEEKKEAESPPAEGGAKSAPIDLTQ